MISNRAYAAPVCDASRALDGVDLPIPIFIFGPGLRIRWVNRAARAEFGPRADEIVGRSWYELFPEALARQSLHEELFRGERAAFDLPKVALKTVRAGARWYAVRLRPIVAADGSVDGVLGLGEELTALVRAEEAARESERHLEVALWGSRTALWTIHIAEERAEMSPQFFELTGIRPEDWAAGPHPWNSRIHPEDWASTRRTYLDHLEGRSDFYESEYRLRTPLGWMWLHDRGRVVERDPLGRPLVVSGTSLDATARKSLEIKLEEVSTAEQIRMRTDLHEGLGQDLAGIQFLLSSLSGRMGDEAEENRTGLERVIELIRGAIQKTRSIAHGLVPVGLEPEGLVAALQQLASDVSRASALPVDWSMAGGNPRGISAYAAENMYRIAEEALTNACRHGEPTRAELALLTTETHVEVSVADDGRGIADRDLHAAGTGLRSMSYRAQAMGAELLIGSRPGGGTQVTIRCQRGDGHRK